MSEAGSTLETVTGKREADISLSARMAEFGDAFGGGVKDPFAVYDQFRRGRDVVEGDVLAAFGMRSMASGKARRVFSLFGFNDVQSVLRDAANFTSGINQERMGFLFDDLMILGMDGAEHRVMRSMLQPAFSTAVIERWKRRVMEPLVEKEFIAPLKGEGRCDLLKDLAIDFPVRSVYQIIGLPDDPKAYLEFASWGLQILATPTNDPERDPEGAAATIESAMAASRGMYECLRTVVAERRASDVLDGDDLISSLLRARHEGAGLDDHQIACFLRTVLPAAAETTTRTFCNLVLMLLQDRALLEDVRADRALIQNAVDEAIRLEPAISIIAREVQSDARIGGVDIPRGSAVLLCTAAAGRDPAAYPDPDRFDLYRPRKAPLGFGFGPHMCIGMQVARVEMEVALNALLDHMPLLRLDPDYEVPPIMGVLFRGPRQLRVRWD